MEEKLQVSVSGKSIYKAVSTYLKESPELQSSIDQAVVAAFSSPNFKEAVQKRMDETIAREVRLFIYSDQIIGQTRKEMYSQVEKEVLHALESANIKDTIIEVLVKISDRANSMRAT
jgi:hypothetical protein